MADKLQLPISVETASSTFALIPPGEFTRGTNGDVFGLATVGAVGVDWVDQARPPSQVRLTRPFFMGTTEVTVEQFKRFVDATGYKTSAEQNQLGGWYDIAGTQVQKPEWTWRYGLANQQQATANLPVVFVTRQDAEAYCGWLSQTENAEFRLPTEAEWEFACRAGTTGRFGPNDSITGLADIAWGNTFHNIALHLRPQDPTPQPVAVKQGNPFGLFDMQGNVWELCQDGWSTDQYRTSPRDNPVTPSTNATMSRGGSFLESWPDCNPFIRMPTDRPLGHVGFRVVKALPSIAELEPPKLASLPKPGEPIGLRSTVSKPSPIAGLRSWTVETVGPRGAIAAIDYSPTAKLIAASCTGDPVIRIYNEKLNLQQVFVGPAGASVSGVQFSPDGQYLAAASWGSDWDNGVRVWELASGRIVYHDDSKQWVPRVAWSPDGKYLAYPQSGVTRVVDFRTGISRSVSGNHDHEFCWSPDGETICGP